MFNEIAGLHFGYMGAILGGVIGFAGGAIGTYFSVSNTRSDRERKFMTKVSVAMWISLMVFLCLLLGLPMPYGLIMWVPYGVLLPIMIQYISRKQHRIQWEENQNQSVYDSSMSDAERGAPG